MNADLSPAQQTYLERLNTIEAERNTALGAPGANADQLNITALRRMSSALVELRAAIHEQHARQ